MTGQYLHNVRVNTLVPGSVSDILAAPRQRLSDVLWNLFQKILCRLSASLILILAIYLIFQNLYTRLHGSLCFGK